MPPTKPFALIPAYSHVDHRLSEALGRAGVPYHAFHECSDLPKCRSQLISAGLAQTDADVFLLIDSDMAPTAEHIAALLASPLLTATSAVTGGYVTRMGSLACRPKDLTRAVDIGTPGSTELEAAGLGFCAVTRASLEVLGLGLPVIADEKAGPWRPFCVPFVETAEGVGRYYPDDWALWARLATVGVTLWLDNALLVPHILREPRVPLPGRVGPVAEAAPVKTAAKPARKKAASKRKPAKRRR
jgi:hypothetical protein